MKEQIKKILREEFEHISGSVEKIDNQDEYFDLYLNRGLNLSSHINYTHLLFDNQEFYKNVRVMLHNHGIDIGEKKGIFKNTFKKNWRLSMFLSFLTTSLSEECLIKMFGNGHKTNKLGEGYKRGYRGRAFFFKINGKNAMFFIDNRGCGFEIEKNLSKSDIVKVMITLYEYIITEGCLPEHTSMFYQNG